MLSREWSCSWSSADRRCSNYIWVINNLIAYLSAAYIRDLTVLSWCHICKSRPFIEDRAPFVYGCLIFKWFADLTARTLAPEMTTRQQALLSTAMCIEDVIDGCFRWTSPPILRWWCFSMKLPSMSSWVCLAAARRKLCCSVMLAHSKTGKIWWAAHSSTQLSDGSYFVCVCVFLYPSHNKVLGGYTGFSPSVRPSIRPSRIPCLLCSAYSSGWIHFIFVHLIKQLQSVCCV